MIVDLRKSSTSFGLTFGATLDDPATIIWVPPGFAHGFYTVSDTAEIQYKTTDYYHPKSQQTLLWTELNIVWPFRAYPILSEKDEKGKSFEECDKYE